MPLSKYDIQLDLERSLGTSHAFLVDMVGANKAVLDVGCDTGYLGEALGASGNTTSGFEINEETAQAARQRLTRVEVGDLESVDLVSLFGPASFDVVVFGDVLEHLRDPLPTLRQSRRLLAPGGSVLISTPNVAHGDVRLALLEGNFRYNKLGILDETHTRFFTRESLVEFLRDAGFVLVDLRRTHAPLFGTEIGVEEKDFDPALVERLRADPEATTYQFVVRAVPDDQTQVTSAQALRVDALTAELEKYRHSHADGDATAAELRHRLLTSRDHAIGAEAEAGQLRSQKAQIAAELAHCRAELESTRESAAELARCRAGLESARGSALESTRESAVELARCRAELESARERLRSSELEITAVRSSTTWRLGRAVVAPVSRLVAGWRGKRR